MSIKIGAWSEILICTWGVLPVTGACWFLRHQCSMWYLREAGILFLSHSLPTPKYCGFSVISLCVTSMKGLAGRLWSSEEGLPAFVVLHGSKDRKSTHACLTTSSRSSTAVASTMGMSVVQSGAERWGPTTTVEVSA